MVRFNNFDEGVLFDDLGLVEIHMEDLFPRVINEKLTPFTDVIMNLNAEEADRLRCLLNLLHPKE